MFVSNNIPTVMTIMGLCLIIEALVARTYFSSAEAMFTKFAFAAFFILIGVASKSPWLAEALSGDLWYATVGASTAVVAVMLYDFRKFTKRLERTDRRRRQRRRGTRRTTPARH